jgi:hypothetical protein
VWKLAKVQLCDSNFTPPYHENTHPYLQAQKVSKIPKIECTHGGLPKTAKSHFGCLRTLGVNKPPPSP